MKDIFLEIGWEYSKKDLELLINELNFLNLDTINKHLIKQMQNKFKGQPSIFLIVEYLKKF